jgi:hypothetical protein
MAQLTEYEKKALNIMLEYYQNDMINTSKYVFINKNMSIYAPSFPVKTKMIFFKNKILVDCTNNFSDEIKKVIDHYNLNTIDDIVKSDKINYYDKSKSVKCYNYVLNKFKLLGIEPYDNHVLINMDNFYIDIKICINKKIKYCKTMTYKEAFNMSCILK